MYLSKHFWLGKKLNELGSSRPLTLSRESFVNFGFWTLPLLLLIAAYIVHLRSTPFLFPHMEIFVGCGLGSDLWWKCLSPESYTGSARAPPSSNSGSWLSPDRTAGAQGSPLSLPPWTAGNLERHIRWRFCRRYPDFILGRMTMISLSKTVPSCWLSISPGCKINTEYAHKTKSDLNDVTGAITEAKEPCHSLGAHFHKAAALIKSGLFG